MNEVIRVVLGLIYPVKCPGCGDIIPLNDRREICESCENALAEHAIGDNTCWTCGRKYDKAGRCSDCNNREYHFDQNIVILEYDGEVREMIHSMKFRGKKQAALLLGTIMAKAVSAEYLKDVDYILPVPLHKQRMRERGYNQSFLLAEAFVKSRQHESIPIAADMATRVKLTKPQSNLDASERQANVKDAFELNAKYDLNGKTILIIDDVFTTGSTVSELAKKLKSGGAARVISLCLST